MADLSQSFSCTDTCPYVQVDLPVGPKYGFQLMGLLAAKERDARVLEAVLQDLLSSGATVHPTTLEPLLRAYAQEGNHLMALDVLENVNGYWSDTPQQFLACLALSIQT